MVISSLFISGASGLSDSGTEQRKKLALRCESGKFPAGCESRDLLVSMGSF